MEALSNPTTRRGFLKGSAALAAAAALGADVSGNPAGHLAIADEATQGERWVKTFCGTCIFTNCVFDSLFFGEITGYKFRVSRQKFHVGQKRRQSSEPGLS